MDAELKKVREEIRLADEELVRYLVALKAGSEDEWNAMAEACPAFSRRIQLGTKVAETKFRMNPGMFRPLAVARDKHGLEHAITDMKTEAAVLERVQQTALAFGGDAKVAGRISDLYLKKVIPETKAVQVKRLCTMS